MYSMGTHVESLNGESLVNDFPFVKEQLPAVRAIGVAPAAAADKTYGGQKE